MRTDPRRLRRHDGGRERTTPAPAPALLGPPARSERRLRPARPAPPPRGHKGPRGVRSGAPAGSRRGQAAAGRKRRPARRREPAPAARTHSHAGPRGNKGERNRTIVPRGRRQQPGCDVPTRRGAATRRAVMTQHAVGASLRLLGVAGPKRAERAVVMVTALRRGWVPIDDSGIVPWFLLCTLASSELRNRTISSTVVTGRVVVGN